MKDDRLYLVHISECIARNEQYVAGSREKFMASSLIQDAVLRNLQVLAESTQRLSDSLKASIPKWIGGSFPAFAMFWCTTTWEWTSSACGRFSGETCPT